MSLSKRKNLYSINCLHFLKRVVPLVMTVECFIAEPPGVMFFLCRPQNTNKARGRNTVGIEQNVFY